jgi:hypothetical protein
MIHTDYITEILGRFEGKAIAKGYVPCKNGVPLGASGVTIGTGLDLGQQTEGSVKALNLPVEVYVRLVPYLGLKRQAALDALRIKPLVLSPEEVHTLDRAVHNKYIAETAALFGPGFEEAPKEVQAVAVSLHYQFGTPRRAASPALSLAWYAMQNKNYEAAAGYLTAPQGWSADHRQYLPRRKQEAALVLEAWREK